MKHKHFIWPQYPDHRRVLAVDPGKKSGAALYVIDDTTATLEAVTNVDGANVHAINHVIVEWRPNLLVIEDQFIRYIKPAMAVIRRRAYWEAIALLYGCRVVVVPHQSWKSHFRTTANTYHDLAKAVMGDDRISRDVAAAVLIGRAFIDNQRRRHAN